MTDASHPVIILALILSACLPVSGKAQSRQIRLQAGQVYTNPATQFRFPPKIGEFEREAECTEFDREGRDIGVGYNDLTNNIAATVFVYPIAQQPPNDTLKGHFETCKAEVQDNHAEARLLAEGKAMVSPGGHEQEGLHATLTFTDLFAHQRQSVRSELYLFTHRRSFILYRITYPAGQQATAEPALKAFMDGLPWP